MVSGHLWKMALQMKKTKKILKNQNPSKTALTKGIPKFQQISLIINCITPYSSSYGSSDAIQKG